MKVDANRPGVSDLLCVWTWTNALVGAQEVKGRKHVQRKKNRLVHMSKVRCRFSELVAATVYIVYLGCLVTAHKNT